MQTRSFRGSGEPARVSAFSNACERLGPDPQNKGVSSLSLPSALVGRWVTSPLKQFGAKKIGKIGQIEQTQYSWAFLAGQSPIWVMSQFEFLSGFTFRQPAFVSLMVLFSPISSQPF
jgi:hypothetical protein